MSKQKSLDDIQKELDYLDYINGRLCKLSYYEWNIVDRMRYGKLLKMKEKRLKKERINQYDTLRITV